MEPAIRIIIADDHPIFRAGLAQVISGEADFQLVGQANDGAEALQMVKKAAPDVAIADIDMPKLGGLELARIVKREGLATRLILLTMHKQESFLTEAMDLGVLGYVLKDNAVLDILRGLRLVAAGQPYISPLMSSYLVRRMQGNQRLLRAKPALLDLTSMERRILREISQNKTTKEIAALLFISPLTVETHRRNLCQKLDLHGSHRLLQFALEHRSEL
jgi:DNA-binding NarL/FixJ family response regulator